MKWTNQQDQFILENKAKGLTWISEKLNRTRSSLENRCFKLRKQGHTIDFENRTRFKKGHQPANKGRKQVEYMSEQGIRNSRKTCYKKGNEPPNTRKDGDISVRADRNGREYQYIRITKSKWLLLHRYRYEQEHGKIPKGMVVAFKDGNTFNCDIDNLELITKSQNMTRNTIHNYPEDIKKTIRLKQKITNKIKKHHECTKIK